MSLIPFAYAENTAPGVAEAANFVARVNEVILYPLIMLLMALALLMFLWGCFQYIQHADDSNAQEAGKMHMLWGIVGLFVMLIAFGVLSIAAGTFGLDDELECGNNPNAAGCNEVFRLPNGGGTGPSDQPGDGTGPSGPTGGGVRPF